MPADCRRGSVPTTGVRRSCAACSDEAGALSGGARRTGRPPPNLRQRYRAGRTEPRAREPISPRTCLGPDRLGAARGRGGPSRTKVGAERLRQGLVPSSEHKATGHRREISAARGKVRGRGRTRERGRDGPTHVARKPVGSALPRTPPRRTRSACRPNPGRRAVLPGSSRPSSSVQPSPRRGGWREPALNHRRRGPDAICSHAQSGADRRGRVEELGIGIVRRRVLDGLPRLADDARVSEQVAR